MKTEELTALGLNEDQVKQVFALNGKDVEAAKAAKDKTCLLYTSGRGEGVFLTASDEWQLEVYQAAGGHLDAVQREIKRWTKATDAEIKRIFEDAGIKALAYDSNFYICLLYTSACSMR